MSTPTPANPTQYAPIRTGPRQSRLRRWKGSEPVRLYAYGMLAAVVLVLAAVYGWTGDLSAALTGLAAAVLGIVPAAEAARASVYSPVSASRAIERGATWVAMGQRNGASS